MPKSAPKRHPSGVVRSPPRVLIVEDEPRLGRVLAVILSDAYRTEVAAGAHEALARILGGRQYDVILSDVMMPGMTGVALHDTIERVLPGLARRMVFMTGAIAAAELRLRLGRLPHTVLDKPLDLAKVRAAIDETLWESDARATARSA